MDATARAKTSCKSARAASGAFRTRSATVTIGCSVAASKPAGLCSAASACAICAIEAWARALAAAADLARCFATAALARALISNGTAHAKATATAAEGHDIKQQCAAAGSKIFVPPFVLKKKVKNGANSSYSNNCFQAAQEIWVP